LASYNEQIYLNKELYYILAEVTGLAEGIK